MSLKEAEAGRKFDEQPSSELPNLLKILNLLKLSSSENDELRKQIENQGGHVDVLVHPYYPCYSEFSNSLIFVYYKQRDSFIKNQLTAGKPIILFEEEGRLDKRKLYLSHDFKKGKLYTVTTYQNDPTPVLPEREALNLQGKTVITDTISWDYLRNLFKGMGINHIGVGGRQLIIMSGNWDKWIQKVAVEKQPSVSEWRKENKIPFGCVGFAATELAKRGFDISFLPITRPEVWEKH
jgi:hypothetical protein